MKWLIDSIARLIVVGTRIYERKWSFLGLFCIAFFACVLALAHFDLLPEAPKMPSVSSITLAVSPIISANEMAPIPTPRIELPMRIVIPVLKISAIIANPDTTNAATLDSLLLKGAVRYPTSASLGETGNVVLFGHSSYLPIVHNQAYKTFNGIQKLVAGDIVTVSSSDMSYMYKVRTVAKESTNSGEIPLEVAGRVLTLSTCDSFGAKTDRFVVVADFVESHLISS